MKPQQAIKGYKLTANTPVDILSTFGSPVVLVQNQGVGVANLILNDGEPLIMSASPFAYEPLVAIVGKIETNSTDVVVFA